MASSFRCHAKRILRKSTAFSNDSKRVGVERRKMSCLSSGWWNWRCVAWARSVVVLSTEARVEDVVRIGWLFEEMACRKQRSASAWTPLEAMVSA